MGDACECGGASQTAHPFCCVRLSDTRIADTPTKPNHSQKANSIFLSEYSRLLLIILFLDCFAMAVRIHIECGLWIVEWIARCNKNKTIMYSYCVFS